MYKVSELNSLIKNKLGDIEKNLEVTGEISNFYQSQQNHWYFTIKDNKSEVKCVMFAGNNMHLKQKPKNGDLYNFTGDITVYEPKGYYQLLVKSITNAGEGGIKQKFEELKELLKKEGLFNVKFKKQILNIKKVGIITSKNGAAVQDIINILNRRAPYIEIIIFDSKVQGSDAANQIQNWIKYINNDYDDIDAIVLARGGGSWEDLNSFNDEQLARSIFSSKIPIVSAVGHETDITIADLVADLRAATPSDAAELISKDTKNMLEDMQNAKAILINKIKHKLNIHSHQLASQRQIIHALNPTNKLNSNITNLINIKLKLNTSLNKLIIHQEIKTKNLLTKIIKLNPEIKINDKINQNKALRNKLIQKINHKLTNLEQKINFQKNILNKIHPKEVLNRGFALVSKNKKIVKSVKQLPKDSHVEIELQDGSVTAVIL